MPIAETSPASAQLVSRRGRWEEFGRASAGRACPVRAEERPEQERRADEMAREEGSPALVMVLAPVVGLAIWGGLISLVL